MRKKKRPITLIEIMIVILLIGLIGGALAFNMRGSIDEGKAFKSDQNISRLRDILMLEYAKGEKTLKEIVDQAPAIIADSPFGRGSVLLKGGWNETLQISISPEGDDLLIKSDKLDSYRAKKKTPPPQSP